MPIIGKRSGRDYYVSDSVVGVDQDLVGLVNGQEKKCGFWMTINVTGVYTSPFVDNGASVGDIDWGDGTTQSINGISPNPTHTYPQNTVYAVRVDFARCGAVAETFHADYGNADSNITRIFKWGGQMDVDTTNGAFEGNTLMRRIPLVPPPAGSTLIVPRAFYNCEKFNSPMTNYTVDNTFTTLERVFTFCDVFDQDLDHWDVSNVTDMSKLFTGCNQFNGNIVNWNVSNVSLASELFNCTNGTGRFNQDISGWNTSSMTECFSMFGGQADFDRDLSGWDLSGCADKSSMFDRASSFNNGGIGGVGAGLDTWNTATTTDMSRMFNRASSFDQYIGGWDVGQCSDFNSMFDFATSFNQDISSWNVNGGFYTTSKFSGMFDSASAFDQDLSGWFPAATPCQDVSEIFLFSGMNQVLDWVFTSGNRRSFLNTNSITDATIAANIIAWNSNPNQNNNIDLTSGALLPFGGRTLSQSAYPAAKAAYDNLILATGSGGKGWTPFFNWDP